MREERNATKKLKVSKKIKQQKMKASRKISPPQLAARNHHYILDKNICDLVYEKCTAIEAAQAASKQCKEAAQMMEDLQKHCKSLTAAPMA
jgi:hypothetical protein